MGGITKAGSIDHSGQQSRALCWYYLKEDDIVRFDDDYVREF